jgi:hypothetical protein
LPDEVLRSPVIVSFMVIRGPAGLDAILLNRILPTALMLGACLILSNCSRSLSDDDDTTGDDDSSPSDDDVGDDDTTGDDDSVGDDDTSPPCDVMSCTDLPPIKFIEEFAIEDIDCDFDIPHSYECVCSDWMQTTFVIRSQEELESSLVDATSCALDFGSSMVLGAQGWDGMDGYDSIDICGAYLLKDRIVVRYFHYIWEPLKGTGEIYCPHHFVTVPLSDLPVEFEETQCLDTGM